MKRSLLIVALAAMAMPATALAAAPEACSEHFDPQVAQLRREIAAAKLDRLANLSRDQAQKLLPLLQQARTYREQMKADHEKRKGALIQALTAVRDDLRRTGTVSEQDAKALREARGDGQLRELHGEMKALREKAVAILTPEQREQLKGFNAAPLDGMGFDHPEGGFGGEGPRAGRHGHFGKGMRGAMLARTVMSDEFMQLLQARAK